MSLGGWSRIWIAFSLLYAVPVAFLAYEQRPTEEKILNQWVDEASDVMASRISSVEGSIVLASDVQQHFFSGKSTQESVRWLQETAAHPKKLSQFTFSADLTRINAKNQEKLNALTRNSFEFYAEAFFLWWLLPVIVVLGFGLLVRWIAQGFRRAAV